ncbi:hypothetical protein OG365_24610 [Streptomyces sp. NBC_00853]|uniref:hypothetical protein n=1 Tax=Streptomyces sp. NBC_00853 TaxID=2903681 RepID=UPI00387360C3|nr:hypothetical protein OG365_24610 [Streptomyces sp. NBC_00853]
MLINDEATRQVAETIGNALGVGFTLRNAAIANGAAHIEYPDGRALGFRPIFGGAIVQLWIIGIAKPAGEDHPPTLRLLEGHRYHAAISLIDAEDDPADLILEKLTNDLLPAFEFKPHYVGHRPWEDAFSNALADAIAEQGNRTRSAGEGPTGEEAPATPPIDAALGPESEESAPAPDTSEGEGREVAAEESKKAPARPRRSRRRTPAVPSAS